MKNILLIALSVSFLCACAPTKQPGFALDGSPIRFETKKFDDPGVLAEVGSMKFTKDQILDKSPVIKDLAQQRSDALAGMIYLKAVEMHAASKTPLAKGNVEACVAVSTKPLDQILARFDRKPTQGIGLTYAKMDKDGKMACDEGVLGHMGDIVVKSDDIDQNNALLQSIDNRTFVETASQLDHQIARILINEEANKAKQPLQEYINSTVLKGESTTVNDQELDQHLQKIGFAKSELTPELKTQFTTSLAQQKEQRLVEAYVAKNILKGPIGVSFAPPVAALRLNEAWKPVAGYNDAPIAVVAFAGMTCPDCPDFVKVMKSTMDANKGYLKLNWIHNFNNNDGVARMMAQAALCIDSQKANKSLEFMNDFSQKAATLDENTFYAWTKSNGLNSDDFKRCFVGQVQNPTLDQHLVYAKRVGIVANPSLWIEGHMLEGVIHQDDVQKIIDEKVAEKQISPISVFFRKLMGKFKST